jgi:hypothetical protein
MNPRSELPRAARISRDWYAAASHPATWRSTIHSDPLTERLTFHGMQMALKLDDLERASLSKLSCNLCNYL